MDRCGPLTVSPATVSSPPVAGIKPPMILSRVDLPQPEGPMMEKNSPARTSIEISSTAGTAARPSSVPPNTLLMLRRFSIGGFPKAFFPHPSLFTPDSLLDLSQRCCRWGRFAVPRRLLIGVGAFDHVAIVIRPP